MKVNVDMTTVRPSSLLSSSSLGLLRLVVSPRSRGLGRQVHRLDFPSSRFLFLDLSLLYVHLDYHLLSLVYS